MTKSKFELVYRSRTSPSRSGNKIYCKNIPKGSNTNIAVPYQLMSVSKDTELPIIERKIAKLGSGLIDLHKPTKTSQACCRDSS